MIATLALLAATSAPASTGTGIQGGAVCAATTVAQGSTYTLPPVSVQDTGSGGESIGLTVQKRPAGGLTGLPVPASWVTFGPPASLSPGATGTVTARLSVPLSAAKGPHLAWVVARPAGNGTPAQVSLGTDAIADLEFTVTRPGVSRHVTCVSPGAGASRGSAAVAPAASVTAPVKPGGKTVWLIIAAVVAALGLRLIFGPRRSS